MRLPPQRGSDRDPCASPIPGAGIPRRGLFVSRWHALFSEPAGGGAPVFAPGLTRPGTVDLLFRAQQAGWNVYLVGNEERVARGRWSDAGWLAFRDALLDHLCGLGVPVRRNYACLDHPRGKGAHKKDSVFRFPNTGCFHHAAQEDGIELDESWLFSSEIDELAAAWRAGVRAARLGGRGARAGAMEVETRLEASDLCAALAEVLAGDAYSMR